MEINQKSLSLFANYIKNKNIERNFYPEKSFRRALAQNDQFFTKLVDCIKKNNFRNLTSHKTIQIINNVLYDKSKNQNTLNGIKKFVLQYQDYILQCSEGNKKYNV